MFQKTPMNCNHATFLLVSLPSPPPPHVLFPKFHCAVPKKTLLTPKVKRDAILRIKASNDDNGQSADWSKWIPKDSFPADKIFRLISSATASPIGQFVSSPTTFLHSIDPRVKLVSWTESWWHRDFVKLIATTNKPRLKHKIESSGEQVWLLVLVVLPARSHIIMRFGLVAYLTLLSIWILPRNAWMDQLGRVYFLSALLFITLGLSSDGVPALVQSRTPPPAMTGLPNLPISLTGYSYVISKLGPLTFTRKGLSVGSTVACLTFTVFQSASLCLTTTTPEQLASALRWFMLPLRYIGVSVSEIVLTLLLSLRFISLVFDEVRNIALGIVSRRVNWKQLTVMETIDIFFNYFRRIFKNIFSHAEQISQAMIARGFKGNVDSHKIYFLSESSFGMADIVCLLNLTVVIGASLLSEYYLV